MPRSFFACLALPVWLAGCDGGTSVLGRGDDPDHANDGRDARTDLALSPDADASSPQRIDAPDDVDAGSRFDPDGSIMAAVDGGASDGDARPDVASSQDAREDAADVSGAPIGGALLCARAIDEAKGFVADVDRAPDGTFVVTGLFSGTAVFGRGEPSQTTLISAGESDVFVARFRNDCTLVWARGAGGPGADLGAAVKVGTDGTVFVTGTYAATTAFGPGETNETKLTSAGGLDAFVARFAADGSLQWAKTAGGPADDTARDVAVNIDGSISVTGEVRGTATFGLGETKSATIGQSAGAETAFFVARYEANGALVWVRQAVNAAASDAGDTGGALGHAVAGGSDGTAFVTGQVLGTVTFGLGETGETVLTSSRQGTDVGIGPFSQDAFVAHYRVDGTLDWVKRAGGPGEDSGNDVAFDPVSQTVLVTGRYGNDLGFVTTTTFGPGEPGQVQITGNYLSEMFLARFDASSGAVARVAQTLGGDSSDIGVAESPVGDGSHMVAGTFGHCFTCIEEQIAGNTTTKFGAGEPNQTVLLAPPFQSQNLYLARYAGNGTLRWARAAALGSSSISNAVGGVAASPDGSSMLVGGFVGTMTLGKGDATETVLRGPTTDGQAPFGQGMFVAMYAP